MKRRLIAALALALLAAGAAWAVDEALKQRSPGEAIRYLQRRLQGHPILEALALPALGWWQARVERAVPAAALPLLGRGPGPAGPPPAGAIGVASIEALRTALHDAAPGQTIVLQPGRYRVESTLSPRQAGRADAPITLRGSDGAEIESVTTEAFKVVQPHWVFEHLLIQGRCRQDHDCEHAFHVAGAAVGTVIRHNRLQDFNAAIKVNGESGRFPDDGRLQHNHIANRAPRVTERPVTPVDIVGASGWIVGDNLVSHFVKNGGNGTSYGIFMKGGGSSGRIERNLVVCTAQDVSQAGQRVGISLGGGGTGRESCGGQPCAEEHKGGIVANNIVAHCNDAGLDVHRATASVLRHNTLVNTAGILLRGGPGSTTVRANLLDGRLRVRPPAVADAGDNLEADTRGWFADADALALAWRRSPEPVATANEAGDFCGRPRGPRSLPGALAGDPC